MDMMLAAVMALKAYSRYGTSLSVFLFLATSCKCFGPLLLYSQSMKLDRQAEVGDQGFLAWCTYRLGTIFPAPRRW